MKKWAMAAPIGTTGQLAGWHVEEAWMQLAPCHRGRRERRRIHRGRGGHVTVVTDWPVRRGWTLRWITRDAA